MRVVYSLSDARLNVDSVVTIGAFDGVHRGHRVVIDSVRRAAVGRGRAAVVVTFFPHPGVVLGRAEPFYLTSTEEKIAVLDAAGIDLVVVMPFTLETARTRAADYVSMLVEQLRMREVHVGYDFAFGYQREGTVDFLRRTGPERGFDAVVIDALTNDGETISSTGIRQALRAGDVARAAQWLGRPFQLSGTVIEGDRRGRTIGVPTANLDVWKDHAVPAKGVYACWAWVGDAKFGAAVNVGVRPTVADDPFPTVEAHLLDFDRNIYGTTVALDFVARLRDERRFPGLDALLAQIKRDVEMTRRMLERP
jgi:riboflavin kinase/FMN adenylyltransferase